MGVRLELAGRHRGCVAATVTGNSEGEVVRLGICVVGDVAGVDDHLEGGSDEGGALGEGGEDATAAAVGGSEVVGGAYGEVDDGGGFVAAVREGVALEAGAVSLVGRLCSAHVPDHFVVGPRPTQPPAGDLDVPVKLVVVDAHQNLQNNKSNKKS